MNVAFPTLASHGQTLGRDALLHLITSELAVMVGVESGLIDPSKSFDEYGLDSINAVLATGSLSQLLKINLPPEFLLLHRTVNEVVDRIQEIRTGAEEYNPVTFNATRPIFLIPGGAGVGPLIELVNYCTNLSFEIPSIGIWEEWLEQRWILHNLVDRVCEQVEMCCPTGSIRLAGYSQGGQLAFAIALSLSQKGREIDSVVLFDSFATAPVISSRFLTVHNGLKLSKILASRWQSLVTRKQSTFESGKIRTNAVLQLYHRIRDRETRHGFLLKLSRLFPALFEGRGGIPIRNKLQLHILDEMLRCWFGNNSATAQLEIPVVLFQSEHAGAPDRGWKKMCPSLRIIPVKGDHYTMFDQPTSLAELFGDEVGGGLR